MFVHTLPRVFRLTVPKVINTTAGHLEMIHFVLFFFFYCVIKIHRILGSFMNYQPEGNERYLYRFGSF